MLLGYGQCHKNYRSFTFKQIFCRLRVAASALTMAQQEWKATGEATFLTRVWLSLESEVDTRVSKNEREQQLDNAHHPAATGAAAVGAVLPQQ